MFAAKAALTGLCCRSAGEASVREETGMIYISPTIQLGDFEVEFQATHAAGPGGQNVNKVLSAVQLRFDIQKSSLPRDVKQRLLAMQDHRISKDGVIVIKAKEERSQVRNREAALHRLKELIRRATQKEVRRIPTTVPQSDIRKRLAGKKYHGVVKALRRPVKEGRDY